MTMQGGLLTSVIANQKDQEHDDLPNDKGVRKQKKKAQSIKKLQQDDFTLKSFDRLDWLPVTMFLGTKLVSHAILGFLLGLVGSAITLSLGVRLTFQVFTGLFMFATAVNLLNVHPIFRFVVFQPPGFIQRIVRNSSKSRALFAPALLGLMTVFIPCGVTQAMEVLAINSGNPIYGSLIMFAFVLGTVPLFAALGIATAKLSEGWNSKFTKIAAYALVVVALYSVNGALIVMNSPLTANKLIRPVAYFFSTERLVESTAGATKTINGVQSVTIGVHNQGYFPNSVKVKAGVPVQLTLQSQDTYSCALAFVLKEFGINTYLKATDTQTFTFTPTKPGKYVYTCSMGMYAGTLEVI